MPTRSSTRLGTLLAACAVALFHAQFLTQSRAQSAWIDDPNAGPQGKATVAYISISPLSSDALAAWADQLTPANANPMLAQLLGIAAVIADEDKATSPKPIKHLDQLRKAGTSITVPKPLADRATPWAWVRATSPNSSRDIEILRLPDGDFAFRRSPTTLLRLKPEALATLSLRWTLSPAVPDSRLKPAQLTQLPAALSPWTFDGRLLADRIKPTDAIIPPAARANGKDAPPDVWIRCPQAPKARTRLPGVLIWCDAADSGSPPDHLFSACDSLNLIAAGSPNAGNQRPVADRFQRAFDALATVQRAAPIDLDRIYITGISGGGRLSSALALCFPDIFAGAAPIVGLASYKDVPAQQGKVWPALFRRPADPLWKLASARRIAPITGNLDFNFAEITAVSALMSKDGLSVRVFAHADMGHTMPTPERFAEALTWADTPLHTARAQADAAAAALLAAAKATVPAQRAGLLAVMARSPWSPAAFEAANMLALIPNTPSNTPSSAPSNSPK